MSSCIKSEEKQSNNLLLTNRDSKSWINYSFKINGVEQHEKECQRYSNWTFSNNGNIVVEPGVIRCDQNQISVKHTFFFGSTQDDVIFINYTNSFKPVTGVITNRQLYEFKLDKLTDKELIISTQYLTLDGSSVIVKTYYFKKDE